MALLAAAVAELAFAARPARADRVLGAASVLTIAVVVAITGRIHGAIRANAPAGATTVAAVPAVALLVLATRLAELAFATNGRLKRVDLDTVPAGTVLAGGAGLADGA
jgi:hypothetical protein